MKRRGRVARTKANPKLSRKELERLRAIMDHEVDLDMELLADTGYSWKEACQNLRVLRDDKLLLQKLVKAVLA